MGRKKTYDYDKIVALYESMKEHRGLTLDSKELGINICTLSFILKQKGITPFKSKAGPKFKKSKMSKVQELPFTTDCDTKKKESLNEFVRSMNRQLADSMKAKWRKSSKI